MKKYEPSDQDRYRDEFTEYHNGSAKISLIEDTENENAWIRSTYAVPVQR